MIALKFPMDRKPAPDEWGAVLRITRIPPNTTVLRGRWRIKVGPGQYAALFAYLQALALDLGFIYPHPSETDIWLPWSGGERPVPARALVEYIDRSGRVFSKGQKANEVPWGRVIAYRQK